MSLIGKGWTNVTPNFSGSNNAMQNSISAMSSVGTIFDQLNARLEQQQQNEFNNMIASENLAIQQDENRRLEEEFQYTQLAREETAMLSEMLSSVKTGATRGDGTVDLYKLGVETSKLRKHATTADAELFVDEFTNTIFNQNDTLTDNKRDDIKVSETIRSNKEDEKIKWANLVHKKEQDAASNLLEYQKILNSNLATNTEAYNAAVKQADDWNIAQAKYQGIVSSIKSDKDKARMTKDMKDLGIDKFTPEAQLAFAQEAVNSDGEYMGFNLSGSKVPTRGTTYKKQVIPKDNNLRNHEVRDKVANDIEIQEATDLSSSQLQNVLTSLSDVITMEDFRYLVNNKFVERWYWNSDVDAESISKYMSEDINFASLPKNDLVHGILKMRADKGMGFRDDEIDWLEEYYPNTYKTVTGKNPSTSKESLSNSSESVTTDTQTTNDYNKQQLDLLDSNRFRLEAHFEDLKTDGYSHRDNTMIKKLLSEYGITDKNLVKQVLEDFKSRASK